MARSSRNLSILLLLAAWLVGGMWTWAWMKNRQYCWARRSGTAFLLVDGADIYFGRLPVEVSSSPPSSKGVELEYMLPSDIVSGAHLHHINLPYGPLMILLLVYPMWIFLKSWSRFPAGCCQTCGYDLRATPDRCPECGTETRDVNCKTS